MRLAASESRANLGQELLIKGLVLRHRMEGVWASVGGLPLLRERQRQELVPRLVGPKLGQKLLLDERSLGNLVIGVHAAGGRGNRPLLAGSARIASRSRRTAHNKEGPDDRTSGCGATAH